MPTIEDGGRIIWESNTIVRYLAAKYAAGSLWPNDPGERSEAERWMDWQLSTLHTGMREIYVGLIRTPPETRDMAAIARIAADIGRFWARLDEKLEGKLYVAGQYFTMGDIPAGCWIHSWYVLPIERPELKNVKAWYERLTTRPVYGRHVVVPLT